MTTVAHPPKKGYRTIRLPLAESEYDRFLTDRSYAKDRLEELYEECAELFPDVFPSGYTFEFIPITSWVTTGAGAPGNCAGRNRVPSRDRGRPASTDGSGLSQYGSA